MSNGEMRWEDAIMAVLDKAEEPLNNAEIRRQIEKCGYRTITGFTPANTVFTSLKSLVDEGKLVRTGRGLYATPANAKRFMKEEADQEEAAETAAADPGKFTVKAYGLYWSRSLVNWNPINGQLWGQQNDNASPVNFADQHGIYLLHSWNEIVYVGQTLTEKTQSGLYRRLKSHYNDRRKTDRWDAFSWFGFRPVAENGELLTAPDGGNLVEVIDVIEAMFIDGLMPRLNMQTGPGSKSLRETGLYFQARVEMEK